MYQTYKDRAAFYIVYIREAHPTDGWQVASNERDQVLFADPKTLEQRAEVASACVLGLEMTIPCLLDDMANTANNAYAGWPDRLYVIDKAGRIALKGGPGPRGFKPAEAEHALKTLLADEQDADDNNNPADNPPSR